MAATPATETSLKVKKTRKSKQRDIPSNQHPDGTTSSPIRPPSPTPLGRDVGKPRRTFSGPATTATRRRRTSALAPAPAHGGGGGDGDGDEPGEEDGTLRRRQPARAHEILRDSPSPEGRPSRASREKTQASSASSTTRQRASASAPELHLIPSVESDNVNDDDNTGTPSAATASGRRRSSRPKPKPTTVSAPKPPKAPWVIDREIAELLRSPPSHTVKDTGYNYIFAVTSHNTMTTTTRTATTEEGGGGLYKIGKSGDPASRRSTIKNRCGYRLEEIHSSLSRIKHYAMVERLVLAELGAFRFRGRCPGHAAGKCKTLTHREYVRVPDREVILASVRRWHAFCAAEPWSVHGAGADEKTLLRLRPRWAARLARWPSLTEKCRHDDLARSWGEFIAPTGLQRAWYDARHFYGFLVPYRWQIVAVAEALAAGVYFRSYRAGQWLCVLLLWIVLEWLRPDQTWVFGEKPSIVADGGSGGGDKAKKATLEGDDKLRVGGESAENPVEIFSDRETAEGRGDEAAEPMDESGMQEEEEEEQEEDESFLSTELWEEIGDEQPSPAVDKLRRTGLLRRSTVPDSEDDDGDVTMGDDDYDEDDTMREDDEQQELPALLVALKVS